MKEPERIPLTNSPRCKDVKKIPLTKIKSDPDIDNYKKLWITENENNSKNNSQSVQQLESYETD